MKPELKQLYKMCIKNKIVMFKLYNNDFGYGKTLSISTINKRNNISRAVFDGSWLKNVERLPIFKMVYSGIRDNNDQDGYGGL